MIRINAVSMAAPMSNSIATIAIRTAAFLISCPPNPCIERLINHTLSARPVEYEMNSSHVKGNMKSTANARIAGTPVVDPAMICASIETPVL